MRLDEHADAVIHEIVKRLDYSSILAMKLVSRRLYSVLSDPLLWIDLCERDAVTLPSRSFRSSLAKIEAARQHKDCYGQLDFERIWAKRPFRDNLMPPLLKSTQEMKEQYGWKFEFTQAGRYRRQSDIVVQETPVGCGVPPGITRCLATSYSWGHRLASVNLVRQGFPEWLLDHVRPRIIVSELAAPRHDCASTYQLCAQLLCEGEKFDSRYTHNRSKKIALEWPQWTVVYEWARAELVFENYPAGVREIAVLSLGKDQQYWAGYYGSKFANLQVRIELPEKARWLSKDEFPDGPRTRDDGGPFPTVFDDVDDEEGAAERIRRMRSRPAGLLARFRRGF